MFNELTVAENVRAGSLLSSQPDMEQVKKT